MQIDKNVRRLRKTHHARLGDDGQEGRSVIEDASSVGFATMLFIGILIGTLAIGYDAARQYFLPAWFAKFGIAGQVGLMAIQSIFLLFSGRIEALLRALFTSMFLMCVPGIAGFFIYFFADSRNWQPNSDLNGMASYGTEAWRHWIGMVLAGVSGVFTIYTVRRSYAGQQAH